MLLKVGELTDQEIALTKREWDKARYIVGVLLPHAMTLPCVAFLSRYANNRIWIGVAFVVAAIVVFRVLITKDRLNEIAEAVLMETAYRLVDELDGLREKRMRQRIAGRRQRIAGRRWLN